MSSPRQRQKEVEAIVATAEEQGFKVHRTRSGYRIMSPDGEGLSHLHLTPSDHRNIRNSKSDLRRIGLKI